MKAVIITDLGFGDAGKGSVVDSLAAHLHSPWVVRFNGGAQAAHNVVDATGRHHTFSQFGSGTFAGARTFLAAPVLINPVAMLNEAQKLAALGVGEPLSRMVVDARARITTPWHIALNHLRELSRPAKERHGSCGLGIGETVRDHQLRGKDLLHVADSQRRGTMRWKLQKTHEAMKLRAAVLKPAADLSPLELQLWANARKWLDEPPFQEVSDSYSDWVGSVTVHAEGAAPWATAEGAVLFEGAQGVLLDEQYGFHPYTTWSATTQKNARALLAEQGVKDGITALGLTRSYMVRHGDGPFPTEGSFVAPEAHNATGTWQHAFRTGALDVPLLRYAIAANGGVDGLVLTHMDAVAADHPVAVDYDCELPLPKNREEQENLGRVLARCQPSYELWNGLPEKLSSVLQVPLAGTSSGPGTRDKAWRTL